MALLCCVMGLSASPLPPPRVNRPQSRHPSAPTSSPALPPLRPQSGMVSRACRQPGPRGRAAGAADEVGEVGVGEWERMTAMRIVTVRHRVPDLAGGSGFGMCSSVRHLVSSLTSAGGVLSCCRSRPAAVLVPVDLSVPSHRAILALKDRVGPVPGAT